MPYEAKTDWKYDDLVTEKDMNRIEQGLKDAHVPAHQPLTLNPGLQVVEVENDTPFQMGEVKGRTLVNLLGRAGACDDVNAWFHHKDAGSPVFSIENSTLKIITDIEGTRARIAQFFPEGSLKTGKFYIAITRVKCTEVGECGLYVANSVVDKNKTTDWETLYSVLSVSSEKDGYLVVGDAVKANVTTHIDDVRLYEISESEYNAIGSMTPEQVAERYPYVDSITNVTNPYAIVTGGNLLPTFMEWIPSGGGFKAQINQTYDFILSTSSANHQAFYVDITPIPNKTYTLSSDKGRMYCNVESSDGTLVRYIADGDGGKVSFTTSHNVINIRVQCLNLVGFTDINDPSTFVYGAGDFRFSNPMLTTGTEPKPFVPQQSSTLAFESDLAAHPIDGSNPDTLFMGDDGLPYVLEKWEKVTLDGSLEWKVQTDVTITGGKRVYVDGLPNASLEYIQYAMKYTGSSLTFNGNVNGIDEFFVSGPGRIYVTIANSDSGWGPDYTPSPEEIKAYFLGWRMFEWGLWSNQPYNRTDGLEKAWVQIGEKNYQSPEFTTRTVPETMATAFDYTPYRLQYLKAKPTVEPVRNYELGATLSAGSNMVEIGSGIVIRERANPAQGGNGDWGINITSLPVSLLNHKAATINQVYKRGVDHQWVIVTRSDGSAYGNQRASISNDNFDPTAVYHVTYTMLDPTLPAPISGTVAANLRGTVSDLVSTFRSLESGISGNVALTADDVGAATKAEFDDLKNNAVVKDKSSTINGSLTTTGALYTTSSNIVMDTASVTNKHFWIRTAGQNRGLVFYDETADSGKGAMNFRVYNKDNLNDFKEIHLRSSGQCLINNRDILAELDSVKQSVVDGKGKVAGVINDKGGGPVSANSTFDQLAAAIRGLQQATGDVNFSEAVAEEMGHGGKLSGKIHINKKTGNFWGLGVASTPNMLDANIILNEMTPNGTMITNRIVDVSVNTVDNINSLGAGICCEDGFCYRKRVSTSDRRLVVARYDGTIISSSPEVSPTSRYGSLKDAVIDGTKAYFFTSHNNSIIDEKGNMLYQCRDSNGSDHADGGYWLSKNILIFDTREHLNNSPILVKVVRSGSSFAEMYTGKYVSRGVSDMLMATYAYR
ncbi:hypothetical protein NDS46_22455 [Paenibacillus thiaminolyticus]|uniref:hypothetical protein n=1 Tax=Paenibacillus thiaminolyticus TaxID=49283 RepID=UPI00232FD54F|nr:hypothetical protein [Paenibacillus thiaminolyticus]WCF07071.1 hypothetical protein NDS46_22455 [Paenibacillus thiaminolyticus]